MSDDSEPTTATTPKSPAPRSGWPVRALHLWVLWGFAVAQPLFDLLGRYPEFLAVKGTVGSDIIVFTVLALVPALLGFLVFTAVASLLGRRASMVVEGAACAVLVGLLVLPALNGIDVNALAVWIAAGVAGVLGAIAYVRVNFVRSILTVLIPAPIVFAVLFIWFSPVTDLVNLKARTAKASTAPATSASRTPVVVVVFDEFQAAGLMDANRQLDAKDFPNFARFAKDSTWYRNATSVSHETLTAVPGILTSHRPGFPHLLPLSSDQPNNLFSLLAPTHSMNVYESLTRLCPPSQCLQSRRGTVRQRMGSLRKDLGVIYKHIVYPKRDAEQLPRIDESWENFNTGDPNKVQGGGSWATDRVGQYKAFLNGIGARLPRSHLDFVHVQLPHAPYNRLPDGSAYDGVDLTGHVKGVGWTTDPYYVQQAMQRFELQVGYSDTLLGETIDRLKKVGRYDSSMIVVIADHGVSFHPGGKSRDPQYIEDIAPVPLFIKLPNQHGGKTDDRPVETIDVLPTIADVLGLKINWKHDGQSLLDPTFQRSSRKLWFRKLYKVIPPDITTLQGREAARKASMFPDGWYHWGPHADLLGKQVAGLDVATGDAGKATLDHPEIFRKVDVKSGTVPARATGKVSGLSSGSHDIALALDGVVVAVAPTYQSEGASRFSMMIDPALIHDGTAKVAFYVVDGTGAATKLTPLG